MRMVIRFFPSVLVNNIAPLPAVTKRMGPGLHEKGIQVIVQQADPNSPLHSVKSFQELNLYVFLIKYNICLLI